MKYYLTFVLSLLIYPLLAQAPECTINANTGDVNVCTSCSCADGIDSLYMSIGNNVNFVTFDSDVTISRGLLINLTGNGQSFVIPEGVTVIVNGDLTFSGSGSPKEFIVDGTLIVNGTLDLDDQQFAFSGSGSLSADSFEGASKSQCNTDDAGADDCNITFSGGNCDPPDSDFCQDAETSGLPVELLDFSAHIRGNILELRWSTASEENFDYFTIERSRNAKNYETIGAVENDGGSDVVTNYSFTVVNPLMGRAYYRLKATDLDGTYEYFQPIMVNWNKGKPTVTILSNPVGRSVNFSLNYVSEENITVSVTDLSGVEIFKETFPSGQSNYKIDANLNKGMYLLKVLSKEGSYSVRFVKD